MKPVVLELPVFVFCQVRLRWLLPADTEGELLQVIVNFPEKIEK